MHNILFLSSTFKRWALSLRPHDRCYPAVRRLLELGQLFNYKYSTEWDSKLSICLDLGMVDRYVHFFCSNGEPFFSQYDVSVAGEEVWVCNYPYAYGYAKLDNGQRVRPSIMSIYRLKHEVETRKLKERLP